MNDYSIKAIDTANSKKTDRIQIITLWSLDKALRQRISTICAIDALGARNKASLVYRCLDKDISALI